MSLGFYIAGIFLLGYLAIVGTIEVAGVWGAIAFWALLIGLMVFKDMLK